MNFPNSDQFTIDVIQDDIDASTQSATGNCLVKALEREYSNLSGLQTNIGLNLVSGQLVAICNIALDLFVYDADNITAALVAIETYIGVKPSPFTATLTKGSDI